MESTTEIEQPPPSFQMSMLMAKASGLQAAQRIRDHLRMNFLMALPAPKGPAQAGLWRLRNQTSPLALEAHRRANAREM